MGLAADVVVGARNVSTSIIRSAPHAPHNSQLYGIIGLSGTGSGPGGDDSNRLEVLLPQLRIGAVAQVSLYNPSNWSDLFPHGPLAGCNRGRRACLGQVHDVAWGIRPGREGWCCRRRRRCRAAVGRCSRSVFRPGLKCPDYRLPIRQGLGRTIGCKRLRAVLAHRNTNDAWGRVLRASSRCNRRRCGRWVCRRTATRSVR